MTGLAGLTGQFMAETVDQRLEQFVPTFEQLISLGIFDRREVQEIVKRRRSFEYALRSKNVQLDQYLKYIEYETAVMSLTDERKVNKGIDSNERLLSDADWPKHIHSIFSRATHQFRNNISIWNMYIDFCQRTHSMKALQRVFAECVRFHGTNPEVWIRAAKWEMFENSNVEAAKTYMEQALQRIPDNPELYAVYAETLLYMAKQIEARRELHGIEEISDATRAPLAVFERALEQCTDRLDVFRRFLELFKKYEIDSTPIVERGMGTGDARILGAIARNDNDPIAKFKQLLASSPSRDLSIEFAKYLCEVKNGDELAKVLDTFEDFSVEESELFAKGLLDCGKLEDAEEMLEDDLVTEGLQRLKLRLMSLQKQGDEFVKVAEPFVSRFSTKDMNSDFLFYLRQKSSDPEKWIEAVKQRCTLVTPEVVASLLKVIRLQFGAEKAEEVLQYCTPRVIPVPKFIEAAVEIVQALPVVDNARVRALHEMNVTKWGKTSTDAWLNYAEFEFKQKDLKKLEQIRWKAQHTLDDATEFLAKYQERFC